MRTFLGLIAIFSSCFLLSACGDKNTQWQKYSSVDGGFSITMPAGAQKIDKEEMTIFGKQMVHTLKWKPSVFGLEKFTLFQISYVECPKEAIADTTLINSTLDKSMEERKTDFSEIEVETQRITINGYPGRAFIYSAPKDNVTTIVKECIAGTKKFDITVIAKRNYPTNAELTVFFNSFQVLR